MHFSTANPPVYRQVPGLVLSSSYTHEHTPDRLETYDSEINNNLDHTGFKRHSGDSCSVSLLILQAIHEQLTSLTHLLITLWLRGNVTGYTIVYICLLH